MIEKYVLSNEKKKKKNRRVRYKHEMTGNVYLLFM